MPQVLTTTSIDFSTRIYDRLAEIGYSDVCEFLDAYPGEPYLEVAERLGHWVAARQIQWLQMKEAEAYDQFPKAAADALGRELRSVLPQGFCSADDPDLEAALEQWATTLRVCAGLSTSDQIAAKILQSLRDKPPMAGWIPRNAEDPIIVGLLSEHFAD